MCRIRKLSVPPHIRISCTPAWICKWNFVWSRWSVRPSAGAESCYEYKFFFALIARRSPWHPTWHKRESTFCLCQRLSRSGVRLLHPASPPSRAFTNSLCWGGGGSGYMCRSCPKTERIFFFCSCCCRYQHETEQRTLTKARWEHLYEPRSR